jgi:hypothetical protein
VTTFTSLSDVSLSQDKPVTQSIARAWRDNPLAISEDDATAPLIIGVNPESSQTASASASIVFTNLSATFDVYEFEFINVKAATNTAIFGMQYSNDNGASYFSTNYAYDKVISGSADEALTAQARLALSQDCGLGDAVLNGVLKLFRPSNSTHYKYVTWDVYHGDSSGAFKRIMGGGYNPNALLKGNPVNAVRFLFSAGNIASGTIVMRPRRQ